MYSISPCSSFPVFFIVFEENVCAGYVTEYIRNGVISIYGNMESSQEHTLDIKTQNKLQHITYCNMITLIPLTHASLWICIQKYKVYTYNTIEITKL